MKRQRRGVEKKPLDPKRIRRIPQSGFGWIDRRFVGDGFLDDLSRESIALYVFLLTVSDAEGLSYYADPTVARRLKLTQEELVHARYWLRKAGLILYEDPLYQVLPLPPERTAMTSPAPPTPLPRSPASSTPQQSPVATSSSAQERISFQDFLALIGRDQQVKPSQ